MDATHSAKRKRENKMEKTIIINGTEYLYSICAGRLYKVRPSGLPSAGPVLTEVKKGSATFSRVLDALIAAA